VLNVCRGGANFCSCRVSSSPTSHSQGQPWLRPSKTSIEHLPGMPYENRGNFRFHDSGIRVESFGVEGLGFGV
jgi:hypothetical protein